MICTFLYMNNVQFQKKVARTILFFSKHQKILGKVYQKVVQDLQLKTTKILMRRN